MPCPGSTTGPPERPRRWRSPASAVALGTRAIVATPHRSRALAHRARGRSTAGVARMLAVRPRRPSSSSCCTGAEIARRGGGPARRPDARRRWPSGAAAYCCSRARTSRRASVSSARWRRCSSAGTASCSPIRSAARSSRTAPAPAELVEAGALCSVTAGALVGHFGLRLSWFALELLRDGLAHSVDSDAHDVERRPPGLREGLGGAAERLKGLDRVLPWLAETMPAAILAGDPLPRRPG